MQIGSHTLCWSMENPRTMLQNSVWTTRTWTFQEAILSRRRLIFTDSQVYYECEMEHGCEAKILSESKGRGLPGYSLRRSMYHLFPKIQNGDDWKIMSFIEQYTRRNIGNSADILNGFQGILQAYERLDSLIYNLWGIPIFHINLVFRNPSPSKAPLSGFLIRLCWKLEKPGTRRYGFPSWSWTGWEGHFCTTPRDTEPGFGAELDATISLEDRNGETISRHKFEESLGSKDLVTTLSGTLVIDCWTVELTVVHRDNIPKGSI
jgi:hypothetical protein